MEIGNGKWEQETHQSLVQCFLHSVLSHYSCIVLSHYSCIVLSNGYMTGFMSQVAFTLVLCFVITYLV